MKFSEAMLRGFETVDGRQCKGNYVRERNGKAYAYCVMGAVYAVDFTPRMKDKDRFYEVWGYTAMSLNDKGMPWEHIYGMAVAAGL